MAKLMALVVFLLVLLAPTPLSPEGAARATRPVPRLPHADLPVMASGLALLALGLTVRSRIVQS